MMWLISILPNVVFHLITLISFLALILSFVLGFIPFIGKYKFPIQVIATIVLCFGLYMEGAISNEENWAIKVKEMELEIAKKETKSAEATIQVVTKYVTNTKVIKEKGDVIVKEIPNYITKEHDDACDIPNSFIVLHDAAAKNEVPDTTRSIDGTTSGVRLSDVTETVVINYTTYHQLAEQLRSLQEWIKTQEKIYNVD